MLGSILCKLGLHNRGRKWYKCEVWHHGEYPWEKWTHLCHAYVRGPCRRCSMPSRHKRRLCTAPIIAGPRQERMGSRRGYNWAGISEADRARFQDL